MLLSKMHYASELALSGNKVYANLVDVINNNAAMAASSSDGLKTVEIIERIYSAAGSL